MSEFYVIEVNKNRKYRYVGKTKEEALKEANLEELELYDIRVVDAPNADMAKMRFEEGKPPKSDKELREELIGRLLATAKFVSKLIPELESPAARTCLVGMKHDIDQNIADAAKYGIK